MSWITLTVPELQEKYTVSLYHLQQFHYIDREAYAKLVFQLALDSHLSKRIVAFWNWLETEGFTNFVHESLKLTDSLRGLYGLALESALCLVCSDQESFTCRDNNLPLMSQVCGRELSLEFVFQNNENAKAYVTKFVRDVCDRAFIDYDLVLRNNLNNHQVQVLEPAVQLLQPQVNTLRQQDSGSHLASEEANDADTDRTLFATFSKGHPITRAELFEFFTRRYGEGCVEDIKMGNCRDQSLYARVIVRSPAFITLILGENELMQFNIHGKDVRVRRFVPKRASVAAATVSAN
ncbi:hypothetical protein WN944_027966 [Citrus x changshan-huyou]|uniref:Uncharacterized protein n=1 Tax=Citrus x changshan-huyou TaxID=2935761 RepID=A0AAP0Q8Z4_9ROSI